MRSKKSFKTYRWIDSVDGITENHKEWRWPVKVGRGKQREKQSRTLRTRKKEITRTNPHKGEQSNHKSSGPIDGTAGTLRRADVEAERRSVETERR